MEKTWLVTHSPWATRKLFCHVNFILRECIKGINIVKQREGDTRKEWMKPDLQTN